MVKIAKKLNKANLFSFFEAKLIAYFSTIVPLSALFPKKSGDTASIGAKIPKINFLAHLHKIILLKTFANNKNLLFLTKSLQNIGQK